MKRIINSILSPVGLISLALFVVLSFGQPLNMGSTMRPSMNAASANDHCKFTCSLFFSQKHRATTSEEHKAQPDPINLVPQQTSHYVPLLNIVVLAALALTFLRQRQLDLVTEYSRWRI
jgi:hypothetical protein